MPGASGVQGAASLSLSLQTLKLESQNSTRTLFTRDYVVACESVHVITCCMLPYIHFCVFTVIEITVIY